MSGMGFMIAAASRSRDERGRYAESNTGNYSRMNDDAEMRRRRDDRGRYMGNDHSTRMGGYDRMEGNYSMDGAEMRQRRDSRGRYMEDDQGSRMAYDGNQENYGRMAYDGNSAAMRPWPEPNTPPYLDLPGMNRRMETGESRMHEVNEGQNPYGGEPEVYRNQREGKTSGGEINYNRADGGYGNVRYFMHKTDPINQHDGKEHMGQPRQIGFQQSDHEGGLDKETVTKWVENMEDEDGVRGGKYTWHQAQQYAMNKGITGHQRQLEFYAAMNAMYSDFHEAGKKFGVDKPEFYACLAKLFIEDPDAVDNKLEMYYKHIVKHEE